MHSVRWDWCCIEKKAGGLGLKDLILQGITLAAKWIFHALVGDEPWKVVIGNNIKMAVPQGSKTWKSLPFCDLVAGGFPVSVLGSLVFKSIWRACKVVRSKISNSRASNNDLICKERYIWWNLYHNSKPLALTRGCFAKRWASKGIYCFKDNINKDCLISWDELSNKFDLPASNRRTYNMICNTCHELQLPKKCSVCEDRFLTFTWTDVSLLAYV